MKADCYTDRNGNDFIKNDRVDILTFGGVRFEGTIKEIKSNAMILADCYCSNGVSNCDARVMFEDIEYIRYLVAEKTPIKKEMVSHPSHYQSETGLEVIDVIEAFTFDLKGTEAFDTGNIIKYICRWKQKNGLEDLRKAQWYLEHLINHVDNLEKENGKS